MMIGVFAVAGRVRSNRHTSRPPSTGRLRSRMIRSGTCSLESLSAWSPLPAISTVVSPLRSSVCLIRPAMSFSSSTTSTRILSLVRSKCVGRDRVALVPANPSTDISNGIHGSGVRFPGRDGAVNSALPSRCPWLLHCAHQGEFMNKILVVGMLLLAVPAWAQFETATVVGTVRDSSGAVVPAAKVTLTNTQTGVALERISDANGNYEFFTVRIGAYVVTAEKTGFSIALVDNVQVTVGARQCVDLNMAVGQLTETVQVSSSAVLLQTDSSDRSQVITAEQTKALPLNGREYSALALLSPGVRLSALNTGGFTPREGSFNVNGLRSTFNNFLIDGVDNNAYGTSNQGFSNQVMQPSPDAIGEFKVVTNNMSAEYGRSAGATINVAYASGTNRFRGSAWEFVRDTSMNATGFFRAPTGKPPLERHQFGGVFGGPIMRNRAFFFADFERFDQTRGLATSSTIATAAQRQGIMSVDVRNPLTGELYPAGTPIPMTAF